MNKNQHRDYFDLWRPALIVAAALFTFGPYLITPVSATPPQWSAGQNLSAATGTLPIANGGTGATSAAGARSSLDVMKTDGSNASDAVSLPGRLSVAGSASFPTVLEAAQVLIGSGPATSLLLEVRGALNGLNDAAIRLRSHKTAWGYISGFMRAVSGGTTALDGLEISVDSGYISLTPGGGTGVKVNQQGEFLVFGPDSGDEKLQVTGAASVSGTLSTTKQVVDNVYNNSGDIVTVNCRTRNDTENALAIKGGVYPNDVYVKTSGRVLIGSATDTGQLLQVYGTSSFSSDLRVGGTTTLSNGATTSALKVWNGVTQNPQLQLGYNDQYWWGLGRRNLSVGDLAFSIGDTGGVSTPAMYLNLQSELIVGGGLDVGSEKLQTHGNASVSGYISAANGLTTLDTNGGFTTNVGAGSSALRVKNASLAGSKSWAIYPATRGSSTDLRFYSDESSVDRLTIQETGEILVATSTDAGDYILQLAGDVLVTQTNGGSSIFKDIANLRTVTINPANRMIDGNGGLSLQLVDSGSITMCRGGGSVLVATSTEVAGGYKLQVAGDSLFGTNGTPGLNVTADRINSIKDGNWAIMRNGGDRLSFFTNSTYEYIGSVLCQVRNSAGETYIATDTDAGDYKLQVAGNEYITGYSHYPNNGTFLKLVDAVTGIVDVASGCFFFGPYSGNTTRTGTYNQSFGHNCLYSLTSGTGNFGAGTAVLGGVTTGGFNTVIGYTAGQFLATGSNNTGFGCNALNSTTGDGNTAVGRGALLPQVEGSNNVAVGLSAGRYYTGDVANKLANSCTYLGYNTKALGASGTNEIVIGANAIGAGSNTVTIGDTNITKTVVRSLRVTDADTADGSLFAGSTRAVRIGHGSTDSSIEGVDPTGTSTYLPLRLGGSSVSIGYYGGETIIVSNQGVLIGTSTAPVAGATGSYLLAVNSSAWIASDVCALSFTDRTPAPSSLTEAYAIVESHESKDGKLDHSRLHPAAWGTRNVSRLTGRKVTKHIEATEEEPAREIEEDETEIVSEPDQSGRNLSKTVSALAMVAKQQAAEIAALKAELAKITKH